MGTQKPLLPWPPGSSSTLLSVAIAALTPFADAVIVVAGKNSELLAPVVKASGAILVENLHPEQGQFSSMRVGLREVLARGYTAAMICPVDSPPVGHESLQELAAAFRNATALEVIGVGASNGSKRGHPLLATRALIDAFLSAPDDSNAKLVKDAHQHSIRYVEIDDPFATLNINTPEEYAELCRSAFS